MSDWADEQGYRLYRECSTFGIGYDKAIGSIATALRKARTDALEEAASPAFLRPHVEAQSCGEWDDKTIDEDVASLSAHILSLKDKPPKAC